MRYRINNYGLSVNNVNHRLMIYFDAPEGYIDEDSGKTLAEQMKEAVRLVVDETAKIVFTSSMQKDKILTIDTTTGQTGFGYRMIFDIPTGKTVTVNDLFTLEFDFGDAPGESSGDPLLESFFGIVKDGDTVKVVTEDGGEEVVEPVGLMDEDDVYDYLEDIAVLMGGITAQQAASITAATRAIIHGGSGSGEGGEGGSGSGSGE